MKKGEGIFNSKNFLLLVSSIFIFVVAVSIISANSAVVALNGESLTIVEGKVYYENTNEPIANADIRVICNHNNGVKKTVETTTTDSEGNYDVSYNQRMECDSNDIATVKAAKNELEGEKESVVAEDEVVQGTLIKYADVVFMDNSEPPTIPEFGTVIGILTALGALGVFFVIKG